MSTKQSIKDRFTALPLVEKIYLITLLILSCVIVITAVCFIVSCTAIYNLGDEPFTREVVAEYFSRIAPITFICLGLTVAAGVLSLYAKPASPVRIPLSARTMLKLARRRLAGRELSEDYKLTREKEAKHRRVVIIIAAALSAIFAAIALIFVLNPARYTIEDVTTDIAYSVLIGLSAAIASFAVCFVASFLLDISLRRELAATKAEAKIAPAGEAFSGEDEELSKREGHAHLIVRASVLTVAVVFIVLGIFNGGMADVFGKAIVICTECIGLG